MELTREILDQITKDATFARDIESIIVSVHPETVLALVAEIERQREKMTWLGKGKMRPLERRYQAYLQQEATDGFDDTPLDYVQWLEYELTWREELATRAAGTARKPDAPAPEIKVGDRVRIIEKHLMFSGESGYIMSIDGELYRVWLDVNLDPGENGISYYRNEIEPA